jgi:DNA-3-methyladenine glycosylase
MRKFRGVEDLRRLAAGPGNLTGALSIDKGLNGEDLLSSHELFIEEGESPSQVGVSSRVGVSAGVSAKWRFYVKGNPFVSKGRPTVSSQNP